MQTRRAYTLLELITVLCICFVLIGLVVAGIAATRTAATTQSCASNLRQLSTAMLIYVSDYDGTFPSPIEGTFVSLGNHQYRARSGYLWSNALDTYIKSSSAATFPHCPLVPLEQLPKDMGDEILCGYAFNENIAVYQVLSKDKQTTENVMFGIAESQLADTNLTVMFAESRLGIFGIMRPDLKTANHVYGTSVHQLQPFIQEQPSGATRHQGGANYAFTDGHVKWFKPDQLGTDDKSDGRQPGFGL